MRKLLGYDEVKKSYSSHPKYYLVESPYNLRELEKYRNSKIVK